MTWCVIPPYTPFEGLHFCLEGIVFIKTFDCCVQLCREGKGKSISHIDIGIGAYCCQPIGFLISWWELFQVPQAFINKHFLFSCCVAIWSSFHMLNLVHVLIRYEMLEKSCFCNFMKSVLAVMDVFVVWSCWLASSSEVCMAEGPGAVSSMSTMLMSVDCSS